MGRYREILCAHCGRAFTTPVKPGPAPKYCSPAHRQRAHEQRHHTDTAIAMQRATEELDTYRRRAQQLQAENTRLREAQQEAEAETARLYRELHPLPPGAIDYTRPRTDLAAITGQSAAAPARHGWRRPRR